MKLRSEIHLLSILLTFVVLIVLTSILYFSFSRLTYSAEVVQLQSEIEVMTQ